MVTAGIMLVIINHKMFSLFNVSCTIRSKLTKYDVPKILFDKLQHSILKLFRISTIMILFLNMLQFALNLMIPLNDDIRLP